jgi:hypothetical protein
MGITLISHDGRGKFKQDTMKLSKKDAAKLLKCSIRTLEKRMKAGTVQFIKEADTIQNGFHGNARVWVILPDPASVQESCIHPAPGDNLSPQSPGKLPGHEPSSESDERQPSNIELKADADRRFAAAYLRGEVSDSAGNRADGSNDRYPTRGPTSVLGPIVRDDGPPLDSQSHMNPALLGGSGPAERHPFDRGLSDDELKAMRADWYRRGGGPSQAEIWEAQERSKAAIREAFNTARRRSTK